MTNAVTNFPALLKRAGSAIGEVVSLDSPELINAEVEKTNFEGGGYREYSSSGLVETSEFKCVINYYANSLATLQGDLLAGTLSAYTITYNNTDIFAFSALVTKIKPLSADAQNPEILKAEITFKPSGSSSLG